MAKKTWSREEIMAIISTNDEQLYKALKKLYNRQTLDEKMMGHTTHLNYRGFNHADARILSSMARYCIARGALTEKQKYVVRTRIAKYAGQLTRIANGEL